MTFYGTNQGTFSGLGGSGSITAPNQGHNVTRTATIGEITEEFFFGGGTNGSTLTVDGLAPSTTYRLELYQSSDFTGRLIDFTFTNAGAGSSGNSSLNGVNRGNTKITVDCTTGTNTSVSLFALPQTTNTMHWYAFSNATVIPEPGTMGLVGAGLMALLVGRRRR